MNFQSFQWGNSYNSDAGNWLISMTTLQNWGAHHIVPGWSTFGFVFKGTAGINAHDNFHELSAGKYFVITEGSITVDGDSKVLLISQKHHNAMPMFGGPVEDKGRLMYIDGCTDSLLIPPVRKGDPCLNLLVFPPGIEQTAHTHPSDRLGCIIDGKGQCVTPDGTIDLLPGVIFRIPPDGKHRFRTESDSGMRVLAFHPDSDFGPEDHGHPMINRTFVDGKSAAELPSIQTERAS